MAPNWQFQLRLIQRRARLFARQIALAAALTATAVGFLASTFVMSSERQQSPVRQTASAPR
jgi:hypothetical protein